MPPLDRAGRAIAGLLTYNPGPGIYSRLERAIEAMPDNVRVQELPGLLKRYKDGVPGWELKAVDLDSAIAGRDVVPKAELLAAVKERSPVYTHGEVILGGRPQIRHVPTGGTAYRYDAATDTLVRLPDDTRPEPDYQYPDTGEVSRLGTGVSHGEPKYRDYGQGGADYAELLLTQPGHKLPDYGSHWDGDTKNAVAHARFDTHGDALRINELQSDLGIYNRKMREQYADYQRKMRDLGREPGPMEFQPDQPLPFPLEDAWADILIKRLALEAARAGHRAIEIASPRSIADKVGGNIDNYEHFYGKVVPGAIERLGRKMGGVVDESASITPPAGTPESRWSASRQRLRDEMEGYERQSGLADASAKRAYWQLVNQFEGGGAIYPESQRLYHLLMRNEGLMADEAAEKMTELMSLAERQARATAEFRVHNHQGRQYGASRTQPPGRRYLMSDEMRKRILTQGIGASLLAPMAMEE